jgi:hypothetical protein
MLPWQCGHGRSVDWAAVTENLLKSESVLANSRADQ